MTHAEADQAVILQAPVVYQGVQYERISGLIYRKSAKDFKLVARGELISTCGHSVTIAQLHRVSWLNPEDQKRRVPVCKSKSDEIMPQERQAKSAFMAGKILQYEGKRWIATALILRKWLERVYWVSLELSEISSRRVQEVWSGSIVFTEPGNRESKRADTHEKESGGK